MEEIQIRIDNFVKRLSTELIGKPICKETYDKIHAMAAEAFPELCKPVFGIEIRGKNNVILSLV